MFNTTHRERDAATQLGLAILEFVSAHEESRALRAAEEERHAPVRSPPLQTHRDEYAEVEQPPILISVREASARLGIGPRTLLTMTQPRGPLPAHKIGARVLYHVKDLEKALEKFKVAKEPTHEVRTPQPK